MVPIASISLFLALHLQAITPDSQAALSFNSEGIDVTDDTMHDPVPGAYAPHPNNWIYCIHYHIFQWFLGLGASTVCFISPKKSMLEMIENDIEEMLEWWKNIMKKKHMERLTPEKG
ncbi:hypothetical protein ARMSODRAFT_974041 [Armillaria solidipes]|uniref:Uncharacterized protein n=1 Tax=Armillaria solidipes TaxID=1076256 RepID=A0A2H3BIX6_9AGAR|nr:hypothetical protein ARMSODRAFT_974041 [Armillaria solidipes]